MTPARFLIAAALLATVLAVAGQVVHSHVRAAAVIVRTAGLDGWPAELGRRDARLFRVTAASIPTRHGTLAARLYEPESLPDRVIVLVPGLHTAGIREARFTAFARSLAAGNIAVLTPALPDTETFAITPRTTDMIEDAVAWALDHPILGQRRPGLLGISFSGGLGIVAAGRPAIRDGLTFVGSLGGHGDLPRVLRFLATGRLPDGSRMQPHDYGLVIVLLAIADRLVPASQAEPLRDAIRMLIRASQLEAYDPDLALAAFREADALAADLPEPAAGLMRRVQDRDTAALGPLLLPHLDGIGGDPALSPERSAPPAAPVFLLHGTDDNVIPAMETERLAAALSPHTRVRALLSPLLVHADLDPDATLADMRDLIAFWRAAMVTR